jgi:glycosyltransferase involved in cell wall biosynthesis
MKILFDGRALKHKHFTGVEIYADMLYKTLSKIIDIKLVVPSYSNTYLQHIWEHIVLPIKSLSFDLLFCPANIAPLWVPVRVKLVVTLHDVAYLTYPHSVSNLFGAYYRWLIPIVLRRADSVITISKSSRDEIIRYYPFVQSKIHVVYNGIGQNFTPVDFPTKTKTILYVGSLHERKNFVSVLQAFKQIQNKMDDEYRLVVIGKFSDIFNLTSETQILFEDAKDNRHIDFLDSVSMEELQWHYAHATLFIFPSFYEGFGFPPLEAMASGTPVITSNISSMPEICGDAALYVSPSDINDIVTKMHFILTNPDLQKELILKGLEQVKKFTWEKTAKKYKNIFEKALI